jgi:hypothetical protein
VWDAALRALREGWFLWLPAVALLAAALVVRRRSLALLGWPRAAATCAVVASMPVAVTVAAQAAGGLGTVVVYPLVLASIATAWAWVAGRASPTARALRRWGPALGGAGIVITTLATIASPARSSGDATALQHAGWALALLAAAMLFARDPVGLAPDSPKPDAGPYR